MERAEPRPAHPPTPRAANGRRRGWLLSLAKPPVTLFGRGYKWRCLAKPPSAAAAGAESGGGVLECRFRHRVPFFGAVLGGLWLWESPRKGLAALALGCSLPSGDVHSELGSGLSP